MNRNLLVVLAAMLVAWANTLQGQSPAYKRAESGPAPATAPATSPAAPPVDMVEQFIQKTKKPVSWFEWGADFRARNEYDQNARAMFNNKVPGNIYNYQRFRTRLWVTITPIENVDVNARLVWEWRNYCLPKLNNLRDVNMDEAIYDILNVKFKNVLGLPLTATVGRQEIWLGDGWLVGDGTPLDGSRTLFFDAARLTYDWKPGKTVFDAIYIQQYSREDIYLEPYNEQYRNLTEQDEKGVILYASNKSIDKTTLDGYFIYKHDDKVLANGDQGDLFTFGVRGQRDFTDHWRGTAEIAPQLGRKNDMDVAALGARARADYFFRDSMSNNLHFAYEFLSGRNPHDHDHNGQFDILWGRWPQWSDLYGYALARETRAYDWTNLQRFGPGWTFNLNKNIEMNLDYNLVLANENTFQNSSSFSGNGLIRGQLLSALLKWKINDHIKGHLLGEVFFPGNYYSGRNDEVALFLRPEIVISW